MTLSGDFRLLTPPREEEEIYPYRRVWRSLVLEAGVLFAVAVVAFVLVNFLGLTPPEPLTFPLALALTLLPLALWVAFSLSAERSVPEPRPLLLPVLVISALVAKAVGIPFVEETLRVEEWLSLASAVDRIIGYAFTVGVVQSLLMYLVLRAMIWSYGMRTRLDTVAYAVTCALGYATVVNLNFLFDFAPPLDVTAIRVFSTIALHYAVGLILSYGLAQSRFANAAAVLLPLVMALASFVTGVAIPLRAGLVNASVSPAALAFTVPRPLFGLVFSAVLLAGVVYVAWFLYTNAEREEREARSAREL